MYSESRKLNLIQEVIKINSDATLLALEVFLNKIKSKNNLNTEGQSPILAFSGIWSEQEAGEIERAIEETCETINPDEWK